MRKLMIIMFAIIAIATQANAQKVYVASSKGATVYHKSDKCGYLKNSANVKAISMADAKKMNCQPCKACYPQTVAKATKNAVEKTKMTTAKAMDKTNKTMDKAVTKAENTATNTSEKVAKTITKAADKNAKTAAKVVEKNKKAVNQVIEKNK